MKDKEGIFLSSKAKFFWAAVCSVALGAALISVMNILFN